MSADERAWLPDSCTLPIADQPLRVAEFDDLLSHSLQAQERLAPTRLRWILDPAAHARVEDLIQRETSCCSFFGFTVTTTGQGVVVEVEVPKSHIAVLDGLHARAAAPVRPDAVAEQDRRDVQVDLVDQPQFERLPPDGR